jgi:hypothetical protein
MAREAGFNFDGMLYTVRGHHAQLAHLEALVRADEREVVEGLLKEYDMVNSAFAKDFRARGNT